MVGVIFDAAIYFASDDPVHETYSDETEVDDCPVVSFLVCGGSRLQLTYEVHVVHKVQEFGRFEVWRPDVTTSSQLVM